MKLLEGFGYTKLPSVVHNPFIKGKIRSIRVNASDYWGRGEWSFTGTVEFENGLTKGVQEFKGTDFDDVVNQIKKMIETL